MERSALFKDVIWVIEIKVAYEGADAELKAEEAYLLL